MELADSTNDYGLDDKKMNQFLDALKVAQNQKDPHSLLHVVCKWYYLINMIFFSLISYGIFV